MELHPCLETVALFSLKLAYEIGRFRSDFA